MCQSIAEGGKRCAAHNRADELKRAARRADALSTVIEETEYRLERAREDAEMLREDSDAAPDDEGARLNAQLAEREVKELEQLLSDQRMDLECELLAAGLTDVKDRHGYRDELLAALPDGANTDVMVDGRYVPAAQVTDELIEAQKSAAAASGEAKRLRRVEDDEDAADAEEERAERFRERGRALARALRDAMGDGVRIAADGIHAVGGALGGAVSAVGGGVGDAAGDLLEGVHGATIDAMEGAAEAAGITAAVGKAGSSGGSASGSSPTNATGSPSAAATDDTSPDHSEPRGGQGADDSHTARPATRDDDDLSHLSPSDRHAALADRRMRGTTATDMVRAQERARTHEDDARSAHSGEKPVTSGNAHARTARTDAHAPSRATHESRTGREKMAPSPATLVTTTPRGGVVLDVPDERAPRMFSLASLSRARRAKRDSAIDTEADQWAASLSDDELRSLLEDIQARGGWR